MRIYSTQLNRGEDYSQIKKVTQINFINETKIKIDEQVIIDGPIIDNSKDKDLEMSLVRLDLVDTLGYNLNERFKKHLMFIKAKSHKERAEIAKGDVVLMDMNAWIEEYRNDEGLREFFDERRWAKMEGREEGEAKRNIEIAKNLLTKNMSLEDIADVTGLTMEELKKLQEN